MNIFYPEDLPIFAHKQEIIEAIQKHPVIIVSGDTGSGKTTQIPKMCLEAFPHSTLLIGCTQPRRIAASTVAARVTEELGSNGHMVGYKIRFHDHTTVQTSIKFMTDGVLLAETRNNRTLSKYGILIIDEAHERSLNIDFLIGYIKQLLPQRPDLKIVITSATIDTISFSKHFGNAPVIQVAGRTFPVTVRYNPPETEEMGSEIEHCVDTIYALFNHEPRGDILVFMATERDIRECCKLLEARIPEAVILPMFGRLQAADQKKIFQNFRLVKIVVATNVAETSITVPGIRYVVDSGHARISYYNVRSKTTSLPIRKISKASCDQRKGRSGRVGPGVCVRLYSEEDYDSREEFTLPELKRSNLAEVILQMVSLNLGAPEKFPFLDPPSKSAIREGYKLLRELGALTPQMQLTKNGKIMADLPIDPCISRILIQARDHNCLREIKIIASILAIQDPRIRPAEKEQAADETHKTFAHPHSDFMALLNIWDTFHQTYGAGKSWSKLKKFCKAHYLSFQRMREWFDLHEQLSRILSKREGFIENTETVSYETLHTALLPGFLRNIAMKKQGKEYQGAYNKQLMIFPGSQQFKKSGQWIIAASFLETTRLYAITVATIEPEWIEAVGGNLCKYSWSLPHWQKKTGQVIATETVSLFGLILMSGKKVNLGRRDPKNRQEARNIFIQAALVSGQLNGSYSFLESNQALIEKWQATEEKLRIRNIVVDDLALHAFYDAKVPQHVYDQRTFNRFLKDRKNHSFLEMSEAEVVMQKPEERTMSDYPAHFSLGSLQIPLEYHFDPGSEKDGVTFRLPVSLASSTPPEIFDWLVPGLLHEKVTYLLKALPKSLRKKMVPINNTVDRLLDDMSFGSGPFYSTVESCILKHFRLLIQRTDWTQSLPLHLQPRFLLLGDGGEEICSGRYLHELLSSETIQNAPQQKTVLQPKENEIVAKWQGTQHNIWDFHDLPKIIPCYAKSQEIAFFLYPVLMVLQDKGYVEVFFERDKHQAEENNKRGMAFLYRLQFTGQYKSLKKYCSTALSGPSVACFLHAGCSKKNFVAATLDFIVRSLFSPLTGEVDEKKVFDDKVERVMREGFYNGGQLICNSLLSVLRVRKNVQETIKRVFIEGRKKKAFLPDKEADFNELLQEIFPFDFLQSASHHELESADRQLQSLMIRLERFSADPGKDEKKEKEIRPHLANLSTLQQKQNQHSAEASEFARRYLEMINEFRISIFSPEIRTREPISLKRLAKHWEAARSKC